MTRNYSIYTKLVILFVVTFFLVCVLFIVLLKIESNTYSEEGFKQESFIKNIINSYGNASGVDIGAHLNNSGFVAIQNDYFVKIARLEGQSLFRAGNGENACTLTSLKYQNKLYLLLSLIHI